MTKIVIQKNKDGQIVSCEISGHTQSAEKGSDIVCAAVSALSQAALLGLVRYAKAQIDHKIKAEEGYLCMTLKTAPTKETEAILHTMAIGLGEIAKEYPKNVTIEYYRR